MDQKRRWRMIFRISLVVTILVAVAILILNYSRSDLIWVEKVLFSSYTNTYLQFPFSYHRSLDIPLSGLTTAFLLWLFTTKKLKDDSPFVFCIVIASIYGLLYCFAVGLVGGLFAGLSSGIFAGIVFGLGYGLLLVFVIGLATGFLYGMATSLICGLFLALAVVLSLGLIFGFVRILKLCFRAMVSASKAIFSVLFWRRIGLWFVGH